MPGIPCRCSKKALLTCLRKKDNILVILTITSVILAIIVCFPIRNLNLSSKTIYQISVPGLVLMNLLKMLILPLLVFSLLSGVTAVNLRTSGRIGGVTILYYVSTTLIAAILGIILVTAIHPGNLQIKDSVAVDGESEQAMATEDAIIDLIGNIFPPNIIRATIQQTQTLYRNLSVSRIYRVTNGSGLDNATLNSSYVPQSLTSTSYSIRPSMIFTDNTNFLGVIFFTIFFGITLASIGEKAAPMIAIIQILNDVSMKMVLLVLYYIPIGVFFLVLTSLLNIGNIGVVMQAMALYAATVITGLLIHSLIILPLIYFVFTRKNPFTFLAGLGRAMLTGFIIQSSSATLPVTFQCVEGNNGIDPRVSRFMLPIGAIINMDGTGLYEAIAAIFIAQMNGISLGLGKLIVISITATMAAIGAATVPSAGLVTLLIVLTSAGLPTNQISLLFSIDWLLDRVRTAINILGDCYGCGIVQHIFRHELGVEGNKVQVVPDNDKGADNNLLETEAAV